MRRLNFWVIALVLLAGWGIYLAHRDEGAYNPKINPADFVRQVNNPYFSLKKGKQFIYQTKTEDGKERGEALVTDKTRQIFGVKTVVYWDRVWLNGSLIEDTRDYLAQHKNGDIWYFGEDVDNYENGKFTSHEGSWLAGKDGALPGIWVKANPRVGETYKQEFYKGYAEDKSDILSTSETVNVRGMIYKDCLKTNDYSPLEPSVREQKYYCPKVGGTVLELDLSSGEREELVDYQSDVLTPKSFRF